MARCATCEATYEPEHEARRCGSCRHTAPAWLDAPDSEGWWWMRDPDGQLYITCLYVSREGLRTLHGSYPELMKRQWQRVAPPREGV